MGLMRELERRKFGRNFDRIHGIFRMQEPHRLFGGPKSEKYHQK
jgi:hypothetical protein